MATHYINTATKSYSSDGVNYQQISDYTIKYGTTAVSVLPRNPTRFAFANFTIYPSKDTVVIDGTSNAAGTFTTDTLAAQLITSFPDATTTTGSDSSVIDASPTASSTNALQSGGAYTAFLGKSDAAPADYTIYKLGSNYIAYPAPTTAFTLYSNTDAYTVIQAAINALTPTGSAKGAGGGSIFIKHGDYQLSNELSIIGWENAISDNFTLSQLKITGEGNSTYLHQTTSGKNGLVIKNMASVVLRDLRIDCNSAAKSAILLDDSGTDWAQSVNASSFDNLYLSNSNATYPAFYMKNFQNVNAGYIWAQNADAAGIGMQWEATNTDPSLNYGNSQFSWISARGGTTSGAGLYIHAATGKRAINLITVNFIEANGYYGIRASKANFIHFNKVDNEQCTKCISLGTGNVTYDNSVIQVTIGSAYLLPVSGGVGIENAKYSSSCSFRDILVSGTQTLFTDARDFGLANTWDVLTTEANKNNYTVADAPNTRVTIRTESATYSPYQLPLVSGTNLKTINSTSLLGSGNIAISAGIDYAEQTYAGTITWTATTAPSGTLTANYQWSQIGKMVVARFNFVYSVAGAAVSKMVFTLPSDMPSPKEPTGFTSGARNLYTGSGILATSISSTTGALARIILQTNAGHNGYEIVLGATANDVYNSAWVTLTYFIP